MIIFLFLTYFTLCDGLWVYLHLCKWHYFIPYIFKTSLRCDLKIIKLTHFKFIIVSSLHIMDTNSFKIHNLQIFSPRL